MKEAPKPQLAGKEDFAKSASLNSNKLLREDDGNDWK
mgnify:CR=1 FL=1